MIIVFGRSDSIASAAIRLVTWSRWSHVGILSGGFVIEATALKGVIKTPLDEFTSRYTEIEFAEMEGDTSNIESYIGAKYDWSAIFGIFFRTGWQDQNKWVCSELIAEHCPFIRKERVGRFTPEHVFMVSKKIGDS